MRSCHRKKSLVCVVIWVFKDIRFGRYHLDVGPGLGFHMSFFSFMYSTPVPKKFLGHIESVKILAILNPIGNMLTSSGFSICT